jgi:hypothetical protein
MMIGTAIALAIAVGGFAWAAIFHLGDRVRKLENYSHEHPAKEDQAPMTKRSRRSKRPEAPHASPSR